MQKTNEILRELREDKELTQKEVAQIIDIRQQVYSTYELGIRELPSRYIAPLADFYGVTTDYLLGRTEFSLCKEKALQQVDSFTLDDLIIQFKGFNKYQRHLLALYVYTLANNNKKQ